MLIDTGASVDALAVIHDLRTTRDLNRALTLARAEIRALKQALNIVLRDLKAEKEANDALLSDLDSEKEANDVLRMLLAAYDPPEEATEP